MQCAQGCFSGQALSHPTLQPANPAGAMHLELGGRRKQKRRKSSLRGWVGVLGMSALCVLVLASFNGTLAVAAPGAPGHFRLSSEAFHTGGFIPVKFTCSGDNISPALAWTDPPSGTKSLVLIVADPDAPGGTWVHWVVYNLPSTVQRLPQGVPKSNQIEGGGRQGTSSFREVGYGGPCPPPGKAHHYHFQLYALNARLSVPDGATRQQVNEAMKGHILAKAELVGLYRR